MVVIMTEKNAYFFKSKTIIFWLHVLFFKIVFKDYEIVEDI